MTYLIWRSHVKKLTHPKWQGAMEDEMKEMSTNGVWDLQEVPNGAKTVGCNGSTRWSVTPKGI